VCLCPAGIIELSKSDGGVGAVDKKSYLTYLIGSQLFRLNMISDSGWPQSETGRREISRRFFYYLKLGNWKSFRDG